MRNRTQGISEHGGQAYNTEAFVGLGTLLSIDFTLARESLALHVLRLDKLYEYYALFRLLEALRQYGYDVDASSDKPIKRATYELTALLYENEQTVNTLYQLANGNTQLRLYYQPVIYGSEKEEHGITFHRKSPRSEFNPMVEDSYYTPDYMIMLNGDDPERTFMLDAKYSEIDTLTKTDRRHPTSRFDEVHRKYVHDIASVSRNSPDAMWLLAGKESDPSIRPSHASSWLSSQEGFIESGIAPLSPTADGLGELFLLLGVVDSGQSLAMTDYYGDSQPDEPSGSYETMLQPDPDEPFPVETPMEGEESATSKESTSQKVMELDPLSLVIRLTELNVNTEELYGQSWASKKLGQNHPVLRRTVPRGKRERRLYEMHELSIGTVFLLKHWRENQLVKLRKLVIRYEEEAGTNRG